MSVKVTSTAGFRTLGVAVEDIAEDALFETGVVAEGRIKDRIARTRDRAGHRGRVFTGTTRQAVTARRPRRVGTARWRQVTEYAAPQDQMSMLIERGRGPGPISRAGRAKLRRWARLKLRVPEKELDSAAYLIARKIRRKGFPGIFPINRTARELKRGLAGRIWRRVADRRRKRP